MGAGDPSRHMPIPSCFNRVWGWGKMTKIPNMIGVEMVYLSHTLPIAILYNDDVRPCYIIIILILPL